MTASIGVTVLVDDAHRPAIERIRDALAGAGLRDSRVLPSIGVITGAVDPARVGALDAVDGVAAVERAGGVQLPPPDSPVQ